jgi:hypothetical protein
MTHHRRRLVLRAGFGGAAARKIKTLIPTVIIYDRWYKSKKVVAFLKKSAKKLL